VILPKEKELLKKLKIIFSVIGFNHTEIRPRRYGQEQFVETRDVIAMR
jgi:lambda repressor-like predicted transcriptional regulator